MYFSWIALESKFQSMSESEVGSILMLNFMQVLTRAKQGIQSFFNKHQDNVQTASNTRTYKALAGTYVLGTALSEAYPVAVAQGPLAGAGAFVSNMLFHGSLLLGSTLADKYLLARWNFLKYSTDIFHFYYNPMGSVGRLAGGRLFLEGANCVTKNKEVLGAAYFVGGLGGAYACSPAQLESSLMKKKECICENVDLKIWYFPHGDIPAKITRNGDEYQWFFPSLIRCFGRHSTASNECASFFLVKGKANDFKVNFNVTFKVQNNAVMDLKVLFAEDTNIEFRAFDWTSYPRHVVRNDPKLQKAVNGELVPYLSEALPTFIASKVNNENFVPCQINPSILPNWKRVKESPAKKDSANSPAKYNEGMRLR